MFMTIYNSAEFQKDDNNVGYWSCLKQKTPYNQSKQPRTAG